MANTITNHGALPARGIGFGSLDVIQIDLDETTVQTVLKAAVTGKHIGLHKLHIQNNGANSGTVQLWSGTTKLLDQKVLAAGAVWEKLLQNNPHDMTFADEALYIEVTGTSPEIQGVAYTSSNKLYEFGYDQRG